MSIPPTKESVPSLNPPKPTAINAPPSPRAHRTLRRLQSAQALGTSYNQPSLISQQHKEAVQRNLSQAHNPSHNRSRSNSDAAMTPPIPGSAGRRVNAVKRPGAADAISLDRLIRDGPPDGDVIGGLESARLKILLEHGVKSDHDGMSSLRIYVWLILLNVPILSTDAYLELIHCGASPAYSKIRHDTFRTLATDPLFRRRVSEASLVRLLNAIAWKLHDAKEERTANLINAEKTKLISTGNARDSPELQTSPAKSRTRALTVTSEVSDPNATEPAGTYVQGMNVLAAPFLYAARSEAEAFVAFERVILQECPGYVRGAMDGVHKGAALVDKVMAIVDPKLSLYLVSKSMNAEVYAFPSVLTLCACTPPLPEVLRLWDFLFAYGVHLNILCIVAQLLILRNSILASPSPMKILRSFPPLNAKTIKEVTLTLIKKIPDDIYAELLSHAK